MSKRIEFEATIVETKSGWGEPETILMVRHADNILCNAEGKRYRVTLELVEPELKPCPFCGGEASVQEATLTPETWVGCKSCLCRTGWRTSKKTAIEAWNQRAE